MKTVVCAYDGSPQAMKAAELAAELAVRFDARLQLAFVVVPYAQPSEHPSLASVDWIAPLRQEAEGVLRLGAMSLEQKLGARADTIVLTGNPAQQLVAHAATLEEPFIVCGSRGMGRVKRALLGSVAQILVQIAECPVLVVH